MVDFLNTQSSTGDGASLPIPRDHPARVAERVLLLARRSQDAVVGVLIGSLLTGVILRNYASWTSITIWLGVFIGVNGYRIVLSRRLLRGQAPANKVALTRYFAFASANGIWLLALSMGFFGLLPIESRVALTMLVLLAVAGGAATYASHPAAYTAFVLLAIPPAAYEWGRTGGDPAAVVAVTLLFFGFTMVAFSRYLARVFERSVDIRFDREQVVEALRTEKLETEKARRRAEEASLAKSRFLANASHDLRQPAQALALYTAVLQRSANTDEQVELADSIAQASRALAGLLNNLLDLSRLDAGAVAPKPAAVDLQHFVSRVGAEMAQVGGQRSIAVTWRCPSISIWTDPILLERIVRNLMDNAIKFTDEGRVGLDVIVSGADLVIRVSDTGCGIPREHHARIFDEFYQVDNAERDRERGLGLGLSIVARLTDLLGAAIEFKSEVGVGSVFTLTLALSHLSTPAQKKRSSELQAIPSLKDQRVLVIDDDPMVLAALRALLRNWEADVDAVGSLAEALHHSPQHTWRICLCDLRLRGSEDGLAAAKVLQARQPGLPIIFISGDTAPERIELATKSGHALLHKPVEAELLARSIGDVLARQSR